MVYDYRESNINNFLYHLNSYNWSIFYRSNSNLDEKVNLLYERMRNALKYIPAKFVILSRNDKPWITPKLKLLINKRFEAYRAKDWQTFQHLKTKVKNEIQSAKRIWLDLNPAKTKSLLITKKRSISVPVIYESLVLEMKILGGVYNADCNWKSHIYKISKAASRMAYILRQMRPFLPKTLLVRVYNAVIRSRLEYCNAVFAGLPISEADKLEAIQRRCHRLICGLKCNYIGFPLLETRRKDMALLVFSQLCHPHHILHSLFPPLLPHGKRLALPHI